MEEEFTREKGADEIFDAKSKSWFSFRCWTGSPLIPVISCRRCSCGINATYQDEGGMFEGQYINGENCSWEPEFEEEEADAV